MAVALRGLAGIPEIQGTTRRKWCKPESVSGKKESSCMPWALDEAPCLTVSHYRVKPE